MFKTLFSLFKSVLFLVCMLFVTLGVSSLLPASFSFVHVGVLVAVLYIMAKEKSSIVWYMGVYYFCLELLVPSYVYGSLLFAGVCTTLVVYWIHRFFFTNRSVYTGVLLGIIAVILYRLLWVVYSSVATLFSLSTTGVPSIFGTMILYELCATSTVLVVGLLLFRVHTDTI